MQEPLPDYVELMADENARELRKKILHEYEGLFEKLADM